MSTTSNDNETIQQRRERILQAQAARQRAREEEIARQEAEFAAEMERIEAEEKAAQEAEEKRRAEEQRIKEEKCQEEEKRVAEERRIAEEQRKKQEEMAEKKRKEERRIAEERQRAEEVAAEAEDERVRSAAYAKLVGENRVEREKAAKELEKRQQRNLPAKSQPVTVILPPRSSGSKSKVFKSKSIISDDSDDTGVVEEAREAEPRGKKRKRPIKMIAMGSKTPPVDDDFDPEADNDEDDGPEAVSHYSIPNSFRLLSLYPHWQTRGVWIGDHASRRSQGKQAKVEDEVYQGPAARVGERRFEGPGIAEQLAAIVGQNKDLIDIARRSLDLQERILHLLVRRERREIAREELEEEEDEDEDEDGEGEEDEEEKEKRNEEQKRKEIREGKKCAD
ncbi:hypothetical protein F5890DRAFT_1597423 [Lentinula detonsa]|uniref:Uncharacterized protein n=1 Tax=Lentinula detonsa TaxID=2804962 RepID=A0AA38PXY5_9AGAR|nr:hypothetical protein F5890DRAFT_1597423 [Lentinula detonsa]